MKEYHIEWPEGVRLPIEYSSLDPIIELIEGNVMPHQRLHVFHVGDVEGLAYPASFGNRESDNTAAGAEFEA